MHRCSSFGVALFSTIAWSLWQWRNRIREGQQTWSLSELERHAKELVLEFLEVVKQPARIAIPRAQVCWSLPSEPNYKGNFDAAFFNASGCASIGVVFRDHMGQIIAALSQKIPLVQFVELVKAMAARRAILFAKELTLFNVVIKGDSLQVRNALSALRRCNTLFGHVIDDCNKLGTSLRACSFTHVRQEGKRLAHTLVRRAVVATDTDVWVKLLPSDFDDIFQSDLIQ